MVTCHHTSGKNAKLYECNVEAPPTAFGGENRRRGCGNEAVAVVQVIVASSCHEAIGQISSTWCNISTLTQKLY